MQIVFEGRLDYFCGDRVTRSLVLYLNCVDRYLSFCTFSFDNCVVCSSSIYGLKWPLWHLQTLHPVLVCAFIEKNKRREEIFS